MIDLEAIRTQTGPRPSRLARMVVRLEVSAQLLSNGSVLTVVRDRRVRDEYEQQVQESEAKLRSAKLVNARSETVTTSNNFRDAWMNGQRCIVPMMAFQEDDWRSGKAVPTRIARVDGKPMGVAGLWESWTGADGEVITSYTLLTVSANSHALMHRYQQPGNEKRMVVILNEGAVDAWLSARPEKAKEFMRAYPANWLTANPIEKKR